MSVVLTECTLGRKVSRRNEISVHDTIITDDGITNGDGKQGIEITKKGEEWLKFGYVLCRAAERDIKI